MPTDDEMLQQLHDKATRGVPLTPDEQARLEAWYARLDQAERALLAGKPSPDRLAVLHAQVQAATADLLTGSQRIQVLAAENEDLRREILRLHEQVAKHATGQPA